MKSSNGNIFRITGHLCGEFTGPRWNPRTQRPVTRSFDAFCDLRLNKRWRKQWWGWWFETPSRSLWRHSHTRRFIVQKWTVSPCVYSLELSYDKNIHIIEPTLDKVHEMNQIWFASTQLSFIKIWLDIFSSWFQSTNLQVGTLRCGKYEHQYMPIRGMCACIYIFICICQL